MNKTEPGPAATGTPTGRTDPGRRMAVRRQELGLTREQLGRRCGVDASYVLRATGSDAAFEVDHIDEVTRRGRNVPAVGELAGVTSADELVRLDAASRSLPWAGGQRTYGTQTTPTRVTGRHGVNR
ncbi:multiprotein-bridging factor 1 family protein [Streptomyces sp. NPDC020858]|uniref:multiprotein-bridging factor 1 family protein n=1 Tax=Streptomyces sp. NPDC020858 TaxID=3365097 RepID=UPI0037B71330